MRRPTLTQSSPHSSHRQESPLSRPRSLQLHSQFPLCSQCSIPWPCSRHSRVVCLETRRLDLQPCRPGSRRSSATQGHYLEPKGDDGYDTNDSISPTSILPALLHRRARDIETAVSPGRKQRRQGYKAPPLCHQMGRRVASRSVHRDAASRRSARTATLDSLGQFPRGPGVKCCLWRFCMADLGTAPEKGRRGGSTHCETRF